MFKTFSNLSRKADRYGDLHFLSFYGATLSRLAYLDDNKFYQNYVTIMGPVIHPKILTAINGVSSDNLQALLDDQTLYGLTGGADDIFSQYEYKYQDKTFLDFVRLKMPQNINIINGEVKGEKQFVVQGASPADSTVRYISIGWSNYGEVYVVADKRMPNTILVLFRGTYSAKTAALYSKPTSIVPLTVCTNKQGEKQQFLYGIFKATTELIHTIIEATRFLAWDFLGARDPNSVKIITAGHSLGGAMCTNFAYLWMSVKKTAPYTDSPYNVLADNLVCLSYGSPRCMSSDVAKKFCSFVAENKILYLRVTTRGDPVPGLPPKTGFQHPCSQEKEMRKKISEDCNNLLNVKSKEHVFYDKDLDCQNYKTRAYLPSPPAHTFYLDILFMRAVDIGKFLAGVGLSKEVLRTDKGSTVCRLILGENNNYKAIFFDVNEARKTPTNLDGQLDEELGEEKGVQLTEIKSDVVPGEVVEPTAPVPVGEVVEPPQKNLEEPKMPIADPTSVASEELLAGGGYMPKIGGKVAEDIRMTAKAFNLFIIAMKPITDVNKCPQKGETIDSPFDNNVMPELSCFGGDSAGTAVTGGNKTRKRKSNHYTRKNKKGVKKHNRKTKKHIKRRH
jgi:hypothetical protein